MTSSITSSALQQEISKLEAQLGEVVDYYQSAKEFDQQGRLRLETNLQAFEKYMPAIAAEFRKYRPNDLKLYVGKSGSANLFDEGSQRWLYAEDAHQQCKNQLDKLLSARCLPMVAQFDKVIT